MERLRMGHQNPNPRLAGRKSRRKRRLASNRSDLGLKQLKNIAADTLKYSASAVLNFSVSRDLADGYARATTGAVIRKDFQWKDVVVAMDQLSAVKKEQPYAPEEFENELMHDGEIQVSGDAVSEVPATNFLVQDGGGHVPFRQTLASPETLSAAGCQKAIDLIQIVAEEVSGSSTLSDEKVHGVLKHFYEYIDDNFGLAVSQELEQAIKDITGKTPDEISS